MRLRQVCGSRRDLAARIFCRGNADTRRKCDCAAENADLSCSRPEVSAISQSFVRRE